MWRVVAYTPQDEFLFELDENEVSDKTSISETINGEHSMLLVTSHVLEKEQRLVTQDAMGTCREFVVMGTDSEHAGGRRQYGRYQCVWSLQHDLRVLKSAEWYDETELITAEDALRRIVLANTARWHVGTVTVETYTGVAVYQTNAWDALSKVINTWGGEVSVTIRIDAYGVVERLLNLETQIGEQVAKRRFDYTSDLTSVRRKVDEMPLACRIRPFGKAERGIDDIRTKLDITEYTGDVDYIENATMAALIRMPDGNGGYEYPTIDVENSEIEDPEELYLWGESVLDEYTNPIISYELEVRQLAEAGTDYEGVSLGDRVQCVDRGFGGDGIRIESRVYQQKIKLLDPRRTEICLGDVRKQYVMSVGSMVGEIRSNITSISSGLRYTEDYIDNLLDNLNAEINATGGYTYVTQGQGIRTYDKAVSDPSKGDEADAVVEVKGGTIRIANTRTAQGEWDWRTVFTSGHVAADLITAANITSGYIRSASGSTEINLDNDSFRFGMDTYFGDTTLADALDDARRYATDYLTYENGELTLGALDSVIRNVLTSSRMMFRTDQGDVAWFGLNDDEIWELYIDTASILNMLRFNNFSWIARSNGNMTLKWTGGVG